VPPTGRKPPPEEPRDQLGRKAADQGALLAALADNEVDYLVLGGLAVIAHGYVRNTLDLDILPSPLRANVARLAAALEELEAVAAGAKGERLALDLSHPESLAVGNYFLDTKYGAMDLVNGPHPDLKRYRRLDRNALVATVRGNEVKVISKDDLIAMKREAGRPKDLADIAALTEAERSGPDDR
jgi:hypothetical protein